jgi:hypothetical protein
MAAALLGSFGLTATGALPSGSAATAGSAAPSAAGAGSAGTIGYRLVASDGGVFSFGTPYFGSTGGQHLNQPIVATASTPDGGGYWLVASDGGVFSFGDARFEGSTGSISLTQPIVGMAVDPKTGGYWLVASDGGIFAFNAPFYGSVGHVPTHIVAMTVTPDGGGYWLAGANGTVWSFGDATRFAGLSRSPAKPIVGMALDRATGGVWLVATDGGIFSFGSPFFGSTGAIHLNKPIVGMAVTPDGGGYWLIASDGGVFTFGDATYHGSTGNITLAKPVVGVAMGGILGCSARGPQVAGDPYSPECKGYVQSGAGSTSAGVSPTTITVAYRATSTTGYGQAWAQLAGARISDTTAQTEQTISTLVQYFNSRFQFYGRRIRVVFYNGQGSLVNEIQGAGAPQAAADAATVRQRIGAFADISAGSQLYAQALAGQKVLALGEPTLPAAWYEQETPYAWSTQSDSTQLDADLAAYLSKRVCGGAAAYAGGVLRGLPRKIAVVAVAGDTMLESDLQAAHCPATAMYYSFDLATMSQQASTLVAGLKANLYTTVVCDCDAVFPIYVTGQEASQNYVPEFILPGAADTDRDYVGQLYNQSTFAHAFGISAHPRTEAWSQTPGYRAYKLVNPGGIPAQAVDDIYQQLELLAVGIQSAGPDLTAATFKQGLGAYPAHTGPDGTWAFNATHYTVPSDFAEICWSPTGMSPVDGRAGTYTDPSGRRYTTASIPAGAPGRPAP